MVAICSITKPLLYLICAVYLFKDISCSCDKIAVFMCRFYLIKTATKIISMHLLFPQDVWTAMHNDKELVSKYMKPLLVGEVQGKEVRFVLCIYFLFLTINQVFTGQRDNTMEDLITFATTQFLLFWHYWPVCHMISYCTKNRICKPALESQYIRWNTRAFSLSSSLFDKCPVTLQKISLSPTKDGGEGMSRLFHS